jgi:DNA polymerase-3 subunit delta'
MEGIGKRAMALTFAKALLCNVQDNTNDSCDHCPSCLKIDHGNHPDVVNVEPDGPFIKIQAIRDMMSTMAFRPLEGGKRVFIIDDADKMNPTAANALLKTLEEPSRSNILLLVTSHPHQLPMTILSRCQPLRFQPLPREVVSRFLREQHTMEVAKAETLAASSGGSISRVLQLNRDEYLSVRTEMMDYLAASREPNPLGTLFFIHFIGKDKKSLGDKLDIMKTCFRDVLIYRELGDKRLLINADREDTIRAMGDRLTARQLVGNIRVIDHLTRSLELNANKTLTLEAAMFKLAL